MPEPHPAVQAAQDAAAQLEGADPQQRVDLLETIASKLDAALSDSSG